MRLRWASLGIILVSCGGDPPPPDAVDAAVEPPQLAGILQRHNDVRAGVSATDPLPPLEWDGQLAATAAAWVAMCRDTMAPLGLIDHNPDRSLGYGFYVGENAFGASGTPSPGTVQDAMASWAGEGASYDYASNTCSSGTCGHYTQLVWRATLKLGCAIGDCPALMFRATLICNYGPGGNVNNQRPY
jgi:hypothetical protein